MKRDSVTQHPPVHHPLGNLSWLTCELTTQLTRACRHRPTSPIPVKIERQRSSLGLLRVTLSQPIPPPMVEMKSSCHPTAELKTDRFQMVEMRSSCHPMADLKTVLFQMVEMRSSCHPTADLKTDHFQMVEMRSSCDPTADFKTDLFQMVKMRSSSHPTADLKTDCFQMVEMRSGCFQM